jgi:tRNA nucleotidyltransferase (CCA-adding enzyme)
MSRLDSDPLVVILTHEHTDFDALASMLAAARLYPKAVPVLPRQMNRNLEAFLAIYRDTLPFIHLEDLPRQRIDRVILVDTQAVQPVRGMHARTAGHIIDHHPRMRELPPGWTFWGEEVGATTTLLVEKLAEQTISLSPTEATLLMLGIYEDTGALSYETTTPRDLRSAAWLLERGANLMLVNKFLHHPLTDEQRALYQQLADNSHPYQFHGHSVIIATASVPEPVEEISTLAHKLRDLYEPDALFMLVDMGDHIQMVARSTSDAIHAGKIATALGGGGHSRAAAAQIRDGTLHSVYETLVYLLQSHVQPTVTVGQIMSYGVPQTLAPDDTIAEAAERIRRYGFEGFPVVENGRIVGMLTRREIDRAIHHGLNHHPVRRYMRPGEVYVTPGDSVETLRKVMTEHEWGQVPVLDPKTGALLGIVTRTDLIKQWATSTPAQVETLARQMEAALPRPLLDLLKQAGSTAWEMGYPLYAVGGFVRDLLLGQPTYDIDLVVEGDAINLAHQLARRFGGRVRSHRRFGTAKWILPESWRQALAGEGSLPELPEAATGSQTWAEEVEEPEGEEELPAGQPFPEALDFVTARMEFYEHPTALPTVERSSIKQDLHRRDFTINTLCIRLTPDRWGELLDFYGGRKDLENGVIRVLHSLSFVEDPTRILRAARFEQRFRFQIEPRTEQLIADALDLLDRVSADRIRHELELIMAEAEPEKVLCRLGELGVLARLHPDLQCDAWLENKARELRSQMALVQAAAGPDATPPPMTLGADAGPRLHLALLTCRLSPESLARFIERLRIRKEYRALLLEVSALQQRIGRLAENDVRPSEIVAVLDETSDEARLLMRVVHDSWLVRQRLDLYQRRLRHIRPALSGDDLRRMGIQPGRIYRVLLDRLLAARLDGEISTRAEEEALVRQIVAEQRVPDMTVTQ